MKTLDAIQNQNKKIAVVGLGYVGLPLALEFAKKVPTIGFDINKEKLGLYRKGIDPKKYNIAVYRRPGRFKRGGNDYCGCSYACYRR